MEHQIILVDEKQNEHIVHIKKSKRRSIGYVVKRDGRLELKLPHNIPYSAASYYIEQKKDWLLKKQKEMQVYQSQVITPQYHRGGRLYYLGKPYTIENIIDIQKRILLSEDKIIVHSHKLLDDAAMKAQLEDWLKHQFIQIAQEFIPKAIPLFDDKLNYQSLRIRKMKRSWGNMRKNGIMTLNLSLMHTPKECIEFVILHELCHLQHFNHSPQFYGLMDRVLPDWRITDALLDQYSPMPF